MSVVAEALHRHGMRTLLYVDDLLIACSSFEEASRARHMIEDTLLAADLVRAPLKDCFDTPTQTLPDHLGFIISSIGKGALQVPERRCFALRRQARVVVRGSQESSASSFRPPSAFLRGRHLLLASSSAGSLSSPRSLQRARAVQAKVFPLSSSCRQPALLAQLLRQEPREPARALARSTIYCPLYTDASGTTGWGSVLEPPLEATRSSAGWWASQEVLDGNDSAQGAQGVPPRLASERTSKPCTVARSSSIRATRSFVERCAKCHPSAQHLCPRSRTSYPGSTKTRSSSTWSTFETKQTWQMRHRANGA